MDSVTLRDRGRVEILPETIGSGAMKEVYLTADRQSVVALYRPEHAVSRDPNRLQRLELLIGPRNLTRSQRDGGAAVDEVDVRQSTDWFRWPADVVTAPRYGVLLPVYPPGFCVQSGPDFVCGKPRFVSRLIGPRNRALLRQHAPHELSDWRSHLHASLDLARAVARLHAAGFVHTDLCANNVLIDSATGRCLIGDIDGLVIAGHLPPDVLGTRGYLPPELMSTIASGDLDSWNLPDVAADRHALAVLIYQLLLLRHPLDGRKVGRGRTAEEQEWHEFGKDALFCEDPTDDSNRPGRPYVPCTALGPMLHALCQRAFVEGLHDGDRRPTAKDWVAALSITLSQTQPCPNTRRWHRWFPASSPLDECPFCAAGCDGW